MDVSIIFVNYKTKDLTIDAINSVKEKTEGIEYEIFVVDNNSQDASIDIIEERFPDIHIIKNNINAGFGAANNIAIRRASGKYLLCLNTDTLLVNNAIKSMFNFMESDTNKNVGVCGGILYDEKLSTIHSGGRFPSLTAILWKLGLKYIFPNIYKKMYGIGCLASKIEYITGADIMFRKKVLDSVGLFDENFFMYFEETDLCKRIKNFGFDVKLVKNAKIIHKEGKSNNNNLLKKQWFKKSEFYYFKKHKPKTFFVLKIIYLFLYFVDSIILNNSESRIMFKYVRNL